jgi:membrane protein YdbS with pleckstrin-like domain
MDGVSDTAPVADGTEHRLDPRVIPLQRIQGGIFMAVVAAVSLVVLIGMLVAVIAGEGPPVPVMFALTLAWLVLMALGGWQTYRWPARAYAFASYRIDDQGIEIRRGVHWRVVISVPRSRVQHIDVSQGPVERRFGLGKLVIYTAGTEHAKVELEGLEHGRALRVREHLLPSGTGDAV